jgi:hypothetical protein
MVQTDFIRNFSFWAFHYDAVGSGSNQLPTADFCFIIWFCEAIGTAATPGRLCQPRVIVKMIVEKQMECRLAGEDEVLGENLPQRHFCYHKIPNDQTRV